MTNEHFFLKQHQQQQDQIWKKFDHNDYLPHNDKYK